MSTTVYIISIFNAVCCFLLFVFQFPRHMEATTHVRGKWISGGAYLLETLKLIAYTGGTIIYIILPCYRECFLKVRKNFNIKYFIFSILLISMVFIDGSTRGLYHYVAYAFINLACSLYVCNVALVEEDERDPRNQDVESNNENRFVIVY